LRGWRWFPNGGAGFGEELAEAGRFHFLGAALFLLIAVGTNILTNNAAAVLFTPIALNVAETLNVDPMIFVFAVIFGANCSFVTPMSYQTNLLVMGPGHYKFIDFVRAGLPLLIIIWLTFSIFAPWYYNLG